MKTQGNYKIENFRALKKPIMRANLEPHIYRGKVIGIPYKWKPGSCNQLLTWDKFGRCSNFEREDCFIDVSKIKS